MQSPLHKRAANDDLLPELMAAATQAVTGGSDCGMLGRGIHTFKTLISGRVFVPLSHFRTTVGFDAKLMDLRKAGNSM